MHSICICGSRSSNELTGSEDEKSNFVSLLSAQHGCTVSLTFVPSLLESDELPGSKLTMFYYCEKKKNRSTRTVEICSFVTSMDLLSTVKLQAGDFRCSIRCVSNFV